MQPENVAQIQEVVLSGTSKKKYKNKKENPAYAIMQEVWKRKKTNGLANYNDYQFKNYEKIEIGLNNIDSAFMKKKYSINWSLFSIMPILPISIKNLRFRFSSMKPSSKRTVKIRPKKRK
ncbi:hypothetical protein LDL59_16235 [Kaistella anthropi]|nr:hypothetical protein [Kaistella anthropi]